MMEHLARRRHLSCCCKPAEEAGRAGDGRCCRVGAGQWPVASLEVSEEGGDRKTHVPLSLHQPASVLQAKSTPSPSSKVLVRYQYPPCLLVDQRSSSLVLSAVSSVMLGVLVPALPVHAGPCPSMLFPALPAPSPVPGGSRCLLRLLCSRYP